MYVNVDRLDENRTYNFMHPGPNTMLCLKNNNGNMIFSNDCSVEKNVVYKVKKYGNDLQIYSDNNQCLTVDPNYRKVYQTTCDRNNQNQLMYSVSKNDDGTDLVPRRGNVNECLGNINNVLTYDDKCHNFLQNNTGKNMFYFFDVTDRFNSTHNNNTNNSHKQGNDDLLDNQSGGGPTFSFF